MEDYHLKLNKIREFQLNQQNQLQDVHNKEL